jgi:hypothetical protein
MPRRAQPVPPIFQPEVAAEAVLYAARHPRRELWVGGSTALAIVGNRVAPGLADHYLARTGLDAQQTGEPEDEGRPDNLFAPVPGDHGAHGRFDGRAASFSWQLWLTTHRGAAVAGGLGLALLGAALARARDGRSADGAQALS